MWVGAAVLGVSFYAALGPAAGLLAMLVPGVLLSVVLVRSAALGPGGRRRPAGRAGPHPGAVPRPGARCSTRPRPARCAGPESDPAGYHLIRGWVPAGVRAPVRDPADPTPYWFVASRRPAELAAAIEDARAARVSG